MQWYQTSKDPGHPVDKKKMTRFHKKLLSRPDPANLKKNAFLVEDPTSSPPPEDPEIDEALKRYGV